MLIGCRLEDLKNYMMFHGPFLTTNFVQTEFFDKRRGTGFEYHALLCSGDQDCSRVKSSCCDKEIQSEKDDRRFLRRIPRIEFTSSEVQKLTAPARVSSTIRTPGNPS